MKSERLEILENMPVFKAVIRLAIPTILGSMVHLIYNLTDTYFIGLMDDPNQLAAISLLFPVCMIFQALGNIFATGGASYISRLLGAKDYIQAKKTSANAFYASVLAGVLVLIIALSASHIIVGLSGATSGTFEPALRYFEIFSIFSITMILQVTLGGLIRAEGATKESVIGMLLGAVINIILDPIMIFGMKMGIAGAAWATAIGSVCTVIYYLYYFYRGNTALSISPRYLIFSKKIYAEIINIGFPASLGQVIMSLSFITSNNIAASYGEFLVAGYGVSQRVFSIVIMILMGYNMGYQPFAGYNYGAKNYARLMSAFKSTVFSETLLCLVFSGFFYYGAPSLIGIFARDKDVLDAGIRVLRAFSICVPFFGIQMTFMVTFQATGQAFKALILNLSRQLLVFFPLLFTLNHYYGLKGFIYAQPLADIITAAIAIGFSFSFFNEISREKAAMDALAQNC